MKNNSIKTVVAIGVGSALFAVIGLLISIPTFIPNTYIQLQYAVQSLLALIFGPIAGFFVGFIGHTFIDTLRGGSPWWSWIIASGVFGLVIGLFKSRIRIQEGVFTSKDILAFNGIQVLANILSWGVVAPVLDLLIYQQPVDLVFVQGLIAGIANAVTVAIGGTILLAVYAKTQVRQNSLTKE